MQFRRFLQIARTQFQPNKQCILCLDHTHRSRSLCKPCEAELPFLGHACQYCAIPLISSDANSCGHCLSAHPPQDHSIALFKYEAPIVQLISQLKFHQQLSHGRLLGELLAQHLADFYQQSENSAHHLPEVIIPVPLSKQRFIERGFNQADRLALPVAHKLKLPIFRQCYERTANTQAQLSLPAKERKKNIRGAFKQIERLILKGKPVQHVALLDDVITTGATLEELTKTIKAGGVDKVTLWSLARTPLQK